MSFHAIVSANELGIIHKDIKPSNIILGETGDKLIDFGIAHISGQTRSAVFGDREGSTPFSSPEHFTVKPNPKMDVCDRTDRHFYRNESLLDDNEEYNKCVGMCQIDCDELSEIKPQTHPRLYKY